MPELAVDLSRMILGRVPITVVVEARLSHVSIIQFPTSPAHQTGECCSEVGSTLTAPWYTVEATPVYKTQHVIFGATPNTKSIFSLPLSAHRIGCRRHILDTRKRRFPSGAIRVSRRLCSGFPPRIYSGFPPVIFRVSPPVVFRVFPRLCSGCYRGNAPGNIRRALALVASTTADTETPFRLAIHSQAILMFSGLFSSFFTGACHLG